MMAPQSVFESIPEVGNCRIYSKMRHGVAFWKSSKSKVWCQMNFNNLRSFRNWAFCFTWSFCEEAAKFGEKRFEFYCKLCFGEEKKVRNDVKLTEKSLGLKWGEKLETLGKLEEYFSATIFMGCWNIRNIRAQYTKISSPKMEWCLFRILQRGSPRTYLLSRNHLWRAGCFVGHYFSQPKISLIRWSFL